MDEGSEIGSNRVSSKKDNLPPQPPPKKTPKPKTNQDLSIGRIKIQNTGNTNMLVKMQSHRSLYSLLVGMQNDAASLEDSLAVSYKTEHDLTM